jgi:hypothetical protein
MRQTLVILVQPFLRTYIGDNRRKNKASTRGVRQNNTRFKATD